MAVTYTILQGDTVHKIAQNVLGDSSYWIDIVEYNSLDYPFIIGEGDEKPDATSKVLTVGDEIIIPIKMEEGVIRYTDSDDEIFGTDILLSAGEYADTFYEPGGFNVDGHGDVSTITGQMCLYQDLIHKLMTPKGSLVLHPEYGSDFLNYTGSKLTPDNARKASVELQRTFLSDNRVTDVSDVILEVIPQGLHITCSITTIASNFTWKYIVQR